MKHLLNASAFSENNNIIYRTIFENILASIITCYNMMKSNKCSVRNNENLIRDEIVNNYLMNNEIRKIIGEDYLFYRELPTMDNTGRVDIFVATLETFHNTDAYYIIECKRLDGKKELNNQYVTSGINRFTKEKKYPFYKNAAGMIGFIVDKIDIDENIKTISAELELKYTEIVPDFKHSYFSKHKIDDTSKIIYHLMLDFSDNISK